MPLTIGLTGGIAAGKSEALAAFERLGRGDDLQRRGRPRAARLRAAAAAGWSSAGAPRWRPDGEVDRDRVGEIVFADPERAGLAGGAAPPAGRRADRRLARRRCRRTTEIAVVEVPLLFEAGMEGVFDATVAVVTADEVRRARAEARGHALVEEREARQLAQEEKAARADARDRERRHASRTRAGAVRPGREAAGMRRSEAPAAAGSSAAAVVAVGVGWPWRCSASSASVDQAIQELTLPLRHEDIIRQQAAEKDVDAALIAAVIYSESQLQRPDLAAPARAA